jgi:hypothetical protein
MLATARFFLVDAASSVFTPPSRCNWVTGTNECGRFNTGYNSTSPKATAESNEGNNGVPWIGGTSAGGTGQPPIRGIGDVVRAGYNLLNGRGGTNTAPTNPSTCSNEFTCRAWSSPDAAAAWAVGVLGVDLAVADAQYWRAASR